MELRHEQRFPVGFHSSLYSINIGHDLGMMLNLSPSGCRIESSMKVLIGIHLTLRLDVPDQRFPIEIEGAVRWSRGQEFGVEFIAMGPAHRERLSEVISIFEQKHMTSLML
jgi:hypothetical protein